jgi:hypothetical protein
MDSKSTFDSLHGIRDNALLLSLGHQYLCGGPCLIKIGHSVDSHLKQLKDDIVTLKRKFPGKFLQEQEVDTDGIVNELFKISKWLQEPDKKIQKKCSAGELGRELEESVDTIALAIDEIWDQVEGRKVTYSARDSAANFFGAITSAVGSAVKPVLKTIVLTIKITFLLCTLAAVGLFALYMTMETEEKYLKQIQKIDALILPQSEIIDKCDREIEGISRQVEAIRERSETRQSLMQVMDLNVKIDELSVIRQEAEVKINLYENDRLEKEGKLEEVKKKPFMKRLFRQE